MSPDLFKGEEKSGGWVATAGRGFRSDDRAENVDVSAAPEFVMRPRDTG
jgi:hypothetical protein